MNIYEKLEEIDEQTPVIKVYVRSSIGNTLVFYSVDDHNLKALYDSGVRNIVNPPPMTVYTETALFLLIGQSIDGVTYWFFARYPFKPDDEHTPRVLHDRTKVCIMYADE